MNYLVYYPIFLLYGHSTSYNPSGTSCHHNALRHYDTASSQLGLPYFSKVCKLLIFYLLPPPKTLMFSIQLLRQGYEGKQMIKPIHRKIWMTDFHTQYRTRIQIGLILQSFSAQRSSVWIMFSLKQRTGIHIHSQLWWVRVMVKAQCTEGFLSHKQSVWPTLFLRAIESQSELNLYSGNW